MAEAFTITKEHRKIFWRTSRMLLLTFVVALAIDMVFFAVNPFAFWQRGDHLFLVVATWIVTYHVGEAIKKR
jgi:hypothetical protein